MESFLIKRSELPEFDMFKFSGFCEINKCTASTKRSGKSVDLQSGHILDLLKQDENFIEF